MERAEGEDPQVSEGLVLGMSCSWGVRPRGQAWELVGERELGDAGPGGAGAREPCLCGCAWGAGVPPAGATAKGSQPGLDRLTQR